MQMIARVVGGKESLGMLGIPRQFVEIDHAIEMPGSPNPVVDGLTVGIRTMQRMIVFGPDKRKNRRTEYAHSVGVRAKDNLLICGKDPVNQSRVCSRTDVSITRQAAEIVHSFEHNQVAYARLAEDIAIKAR